MKKKIVIINEVCSIRLAVVANKRKVLAVSSLKKVESRLVSWQIKALG